MPLSLVLAIGCGGPTGPGPQEASFAPGQRVAAAQGVALELSAAHYELDQVTLTVKLDNRGDVPLMAERKGMLLEYGELEFPVSDDTTATLDETPLAETVVVPPGEQVELSLRFVMEQALVQAATLHLLSLRREDDQWLEPLRLAVPPPAAFVDAAQPPPEEP